MVTVAYETFLKDVKDKLLDTIQGTTTFDGSPGIAYVDYFKDVDVDENPSARLEINDDSFDDIGAFLTEHLVSFSIRVRYLAGYVESDLDTMIGYVGEIVDAIEADRTLGSAYISNTEITNTSWSQSELSGGRGVTRYCVITVVSQGLRNA